MPLATRKKRYRVRIDPLDDLFSEFIRKRAMKRAGGCERCLSQKDSYMRLQCSHFHGRRKHSTRWDEDNAAGLCAGCHMHLTSHPFEHTQWFTEHLGQGQLDMLNVRALSIGKVDKALIKLYLLEQIRLLEPTLSGAK